MYVVRDKQSGEVLHINPAPTYQKLTPAEVYYRFDRKTMELGSTAGPLPDRFHIEEDGRIVEWSLEEKVKAGIVLLEPTQEIKAGQMVEKSLRRQVDEGLLWLAPGQKIEADQIVAMSLEEKVEAGLVRIAPTEKIEQGQVVAKSLAEQVKEGLIQIDEPFQSLDGDQIVTRDLRDLVKMRLLKTDLQRERARQRIDAEIERAVAERFSPGCEMKTIKDFLDWMNAGRPTNDPRETTYAEMQKTIGAIKADYRALKRQLQAKPSAKTPKSRT